MLDERRLVNALSANVIEADTIQGSEISEQRQRNHIMYAMDSLENEKKQRSQHISGDVLDAVESQKSYYLEALLSSRQILQFPQQDNRDQTAHLATEYVEEQLFSEQNDGYNLMRDALHDAFVAKRAVVEVEWDNTPVHEIREVDNLNQAQVAIISTTPGFELLGYEQQPDGTFNTDLKVTVSSGRVRIRLLQPERYYRDPNVSYVKDAAFAGYQEDMTRAEAARRGHDPEELKKLKLDYRFRQNEEDSARKAHDSSWSRARRHKRQPEQEIITVYTHVAVLDLAEFADNADEVPEGPRLYKFVWSHNELLTQPNGQKFTEYSEYPFIEWTQYKLSHSEFGLCEADINADIQWSKSNIMRLSIDNLAMVNTSRWKAVKGAVTNPRELLDNRIGSTLWLKNRQAMDDVQPLETPQLSPYTFHVMEQLNTEKENRSGMSRLAKGLNADAVAKQNADDMVERLTNASNRRVMRGVRDFAKSFLAPLYLRVYNLGVRFDKQEYDVEIAGQWTKLSPSQWPMRRKCEVEQALTPEECEEQARFLIALDQKMSADPKMSVLYGLEQQYSLWEDVCDRMRVANVNRYMMRPNDPRVQMAMKQRQQAAMHQHQMVMKAQQAELAEKQSKDQREWMKARLDGTLTQAKIEDMAEDNQRQDAEFEHEKVMDFAEYQLEKQQKRPVSV